MHLSYSIVKLSMTFEGRCKALSDVAKVGGPRVTGDREEFYLLPLSIKACRYLFFENLILLRDEVCRFGITGIVLPLVVLALAL